MKRTLAILLLAFCFSQLSNAQQIIHTNVKSTCIYNGTADLQSCVDENVDAVITFKENNFLIIHTVNGVSVNYTINSKFYEAPKWKYVISDANGTQFNLWSNQATKEFSFAPADPENGATVYRYRNN